MTRRARKSYPVDIHGGKRLSGRKDPGLPFREPSVDVHHPELMIHVEIREKIYIYSRSFRDREECLVGTNGKAMLLLSGGIDSPVAGYMISKRGVTLEATYFHAPPYTSERAKQKVVDLARLVARYSGPIRLHVVNSRIFSSTFMISAPMMNRRLSCAAI